MVSVCAGGIAGSKKRSSELRPTTYAVPPPNATGSTADYTWGQWGDVPLTYQDSSGQWNIAVWRPSSGRLYWNNIHTAITGSFVYGLPGDIPRFGDTNGDSWDELILYRPSNGRWFNSGLGGWVAWGGVSDIAVAR